MQSSRGRQAHAQDRRNHDIVTRGRYQSHQGKNCGANPNEEQLLASVSVRQSREQDQAYDPANEIDRADELYFVTWCAN